MRGLRKRITEPCHFELSAGNAASCPYTIVVELEIYAIREPTRTKLKIDPASVQDVQEPPGKPRASKVIFKDGKNRICVGFPDEVRAKLGKK